MGRWCAKAQERSGWLPTADWLIAAVEPALAGWSRVPFLIKGVLHAQGKIPSPAVRLPLLPASQDTIRTAVGLR